MKQAYQYLNEFIIVHNLDVNDFYDISFSHDRIRFQGKFNKQLENYFEKIFKGKPQTKVHETEEGFDRFSVFNYFEKGTNMTIRITFTN